VKNTNTKRKLTKFLSSGNNLSERSIKGGVWTFALRITDRFFMIIRTLTLVRILLPDDFGLIGIALLSMSALDTFSRIGFDTALIQKKENTHTYLDMTWTIQVIRGIILSGILIAIAPVVGIFFSLPKATNIIRVIAFTELLIGFTNIGVLYFQKELEFNKQFLYKISGTLSDLLIAVPAAFILRNVWALVFGFLASQVTRLIMSYIIHSYRPHLAFNRRQFIELLQFGKWIFGSSIFVFLATQGDNIIVGKLLGASALGFYQMAYMISNTPATEISNVVSEVSFPAFSKLQDNTAKLGEAYLKVLQLITFISIPLAGMIFILAPQFTEIFLGEKWIPMVPAIQVLVIAGLFRSIASTPIFNSVGKPIIETIWQGIRLAVFAIFVYPLAIWRNILGVSISVLISSLISTIGFNLMAIKVTQCEVKKFYKYLRRESTCIYAW
jgi:O-antigen/teichoic acid export membrane protein